MRKLSIRDLDLHDKRVFMRVDFNVPISEGRIRDDMRVLQTLETIRYGLERNAKLVLASHLGRPKGKPDPEQSLRPVAELLHELLGRPGQFVEDCVGPAAEQAAAAERARIARELHDIVAHHLSVVVLQAAGARASGKAAEAALEKIEHSGRQALAETRRLLGVLRDTDEETGLAPQPGISGLDALAGTVRAAGLPVNLVIDGDHTALPAAVDVSVYRIVQEALTNILKHAGGACADVTIGCADEAVTIEITDDGTGEPGNRAPAGGHGLAGMRGRAAIFGGELHAGPRPGGGFAVRARLPLADRLPLRDGLA